MSTDEHPEYAPKVVPPGEMEQRGLIGDLAQAAEAGAVWYGIYQATHPKPPPPNPPKQDNK
jgi:hypothetical protein